MITIFIIMLGWSAIGFFTLTLIMEGTNAILLEDMLTPWGIYNNIDVNLFGTIVLTIVFNLLCPIWSIGWWFYWLCTVGRK